MKKPPNTCRVPPLYAQLLIISLRTTQTTAFRFMPRSRATCGVARTWRTRRGASPSPRSTSARRTGSRTSSSATPSPSSYVPPPSVPGLPSPTIYPWPGHFGDHPTPVSRGPAKRLARGQPASLYQPRSYPLGLSFRKLKGRQFGHLMPPNQSVAFLATGY